MSFIASSVPLAAPLNTTRNRTLNLVRKYTTCTCSKDLAIAVRPRHSLRFPNPRKDFKLAPSTASPANSPSNIASQRSQAIARHLSTSAQPQDNMNLYSYSKTPSEYTPRTVGQPYTLDYRCYVEKNGQPVSPFHDIPLYANEQQTILNMVVEIPRWSNAKQEVRSPYSISKVRH